MKLELTKEEGNLRKAIDERLKKVQKLLAEYRLDDEVQKLIEEMGKDAHELHILLKKRGYEPKHHAYMIKNREAQPEDPKFYMHIHPVEDLLAYIEDTHANDDFQDQTVGQEFEFRVYSRRWGREDTYKIKRTEGGWDLLPPSRGGPCDKGGQPFLFEKLRQDQIQYPNDLDSWLERLWDQAATKGLSREEVQQALKELADWINSIEKNTPSGLVWESYS